MTDQEIFVQMALKAWDIQVQRAGKFFDSQSDDALLKEVAPGRNRLVYLLGHLIAVHDTMISLLGMGLRMYPALDEPFVKQPDRSGLPTPDVATLRADWKTLHEALKGYFDQLPAADWFKRHTAMTDEDLARDPTRNRLSVLLNRTSHLSYHLGQLMLVK